MTTNICVIKVRHFQKLIHLEYEKYGNLIYYTKVNKITRIDYTVLW